MVDPWPVAILDLFGDRQIAEVKWPAARRRIVQAPPDREPDLPFEPEPRTAAVDELLLRHLRDAGRCSLRVAAAGAGLTRSTTERALHRLRAAGAVRLDLDGWHAR